MNVILHGEGKEKRMHLTETDQFQNKITVPVKIFTGTKNKWAAPVCIDRDLVYKFIYQDGPYYHYQLVNHVTSKQS